MPRGIYSNLRCNKKRTNTFVPTEHQKDTLKAFLKSPYKGLLLYHKLGSGKTCTSLLIADRMIKEKKIKHVYILTPGSLRSGWITEYCTVCGKKDRYLRKYYTFITYNYSVGNNLPNFDDSLVIIDEIHNLINGAKNMSNHPTKIYDTLDKAKCRILALTGTPIYQYVYEFALLGRLLKPGDDFPEIRHDGNIDVEAFMKIFIKENTGILKLDKDGNLVPKNRALLNARLKGIVSYFPGAGKDLVPEVIEQEPFRCKMTRDQEINYWGAFYQEKMMEFPPSKSLKKEDFARYKLLEQLYIMAKKRIMTRSASNFFYPKDIKKVPDKPVDEDGWISEEKFTGQKLLKLYSPKLAYFFTNLVMHNRQKHLLFTFFKTKAGVILIKNLLEELAVRKGINLKAKIFSGDLTDSKRKNLLRKFNSDDNKYGDKIRILLVTEAGAEGISVNNVRHMHILESSPRISKTVQAIGRVARYKSHITLPKNQRNVKIWRYWSVASGDRMNVKVKVYTSDGEMEHVDKEFGNDKTVDEILYDKGKHTIDEMNSFLQILQQNSVTKWKSD